VAGVVAAAAICLAGCTTSGSDRESGTTCDVTTTTQPAPADSAAYTVEQLRLSFRLPQAYQPGTDPDLAFLARSIDPPSIFTIDGPSGDLGPPPDRDGETSKPITLGCAEGYTITNAAIADLPAGITANELVINDGDRSFSVIMSARSDDLAAAWPVFIDSVAIR